MNKYKKIKLYGELNGIFFLLILSSTVFAQERIIQLGNSGIKLKNNNFYLLKVIDERIDKRKIGTVYHTNHEVVNLNLLNGTVHSSESFLSKLYKKNSSAYPIVLKIKELKISEKVTSAGTVNGISEIKVEFGLMKDTALIDLTGFQTKINFTRSVHLNKQFDYLIGRLLEKSMIYFDQWMTVNYDKNPQLAIAIKLNIKPDYGQEFPDRGDTIFWAPDHKITWKDFQGTAPTNTKYAAKVFTNFEYNASAIMKNAIIIIDLQLKIYMLKSSSWKVFSLSEDHLAHEQLHFDITKIIAEKYKKRASEILTLDNYDSELQLLFIEMYREFNRLQKQYDADSNHSINFVGQQKWQLIISDELRAIRNP